MDKLRAEAHQLAEAVGELNASVQKLGARTRRSERLILGIGVSLTVSIGLAMVMAVSAWRVAEEFDCMRSALEARSVASGQSNQASIEQLKSQNALLGTLLTGVTNRDQGREALMTYQRGVAGGIAALEDLERARMQNPLSAQCD